MDKLEEFFILIQIIILLATMIVSGLTFYWSHMFSKKSKIQSDSNKLFELEKERLKLQAQIIELSRTKANYRQSALDDVSDQNEQNLMLSARLRECYQMLSGIQLEMKHILDAVGDCYTNFTLPQCRLFAECWDKFLNFDKATFFWEHAINMDESNSAIKSETLRYYGLFLFNNGLKDAGNKQFYKSVELNDDNDCGRYINATTYSTWIRAYHIYLMNYPQNAETQSLCMKEIGDIIKKYTVVVKSIRHRGKRTQAMEDLEEANRIINSLNQIVKAN